MSSEVITRNDLKAIFDEVMPPTLPATSVSATDASGTTSTVQSILTWLFTPTSWTNITLSSGFTSKGNNRYRKIGPFVEVEVSFATSTAHTSYTQCTSTALPTDCRPSQALKIPVQGNTSVVCVVEIQSNGLMQMYNSTTTGSWFVGRVVYCPL